MARTGYGILILGFWYYLLLSSYRKNSEVFGSFDSPYFWLWLIGLIAPVYFVRKITKTAVAALKQVRFVFDRSTHSISLNGKVIGQFTDIESIQVKEFEGDGASSYQLTVKMIDGRTIDIEPESNNGFNLSTIAKLLAEHTGKTTSISSQ